MTRPFALRHREVEYQISTAESKPHICLACGNPCGCTFPGTETRTESRIHVVKEVSGKEVFSHGARLTDAEYDAIRLAPVRARMVTEIRGKAARQLEHYLAGKGKELYEWRTERVDWSSGGNAIPKLCEVCGAPCGVVTFSPSNPDQRAAADKHDWSVSDNRRCIAQGIATKRKARLIAAAPELARIVRLPTEEVVA